MLVVNSVFKSYLLYLCLLLLIVIDLIFSWLYKFFMKKKIALIIGVTGQDGSYLAEFLLKKKIYRIWNGKTIFDAKHPKNRSYLSS